MGGGAVGGTTDFTNGSSESGGNIQKQHLPIEKTPF